MTTIKARTPTRFKKLFMVLHLRSQGKARRLVLPTFVKVSRLLTTHKELVGAATRLRRRLVTPRPSRVFWSLRADHYLLEQWDLETGSRLRAVVAEDDWVSHAWRNHEQTVQDPPILLSLLEDDGLLWVVGAEPSEPDAEGPVRHGEPGAPGRDRGEVMDLRLEVLDPASGSAIARVTLPHYAGFFMSTGELVTFRSIEPPGRMQIWSFELGCDSPAPTPGPP